MLLCPELTGEKQNTEKGRRKKLMCPCKNKHRKNLADTEQACEAKGMRLCRNKAELEEQFAAMQSGLGKESQKKQAKLCMSKLSRSPYTEESTRGKAKKFGFCCSGEAEKPEGGTQHPFACAHTMGGVEFRLYEEAPGVGGCTDSKGTWGVSKKDLVACPALNRQQDVYGPFCTRQKGRLCDFDSEIAPLTEKLLEKCGDDCQEGLSEEERKGLEERRCLAHALKRVNRSNEFKLDVHHAGSAGQTEKRFVMCCFGGGGGASAAKPKKKRRSRSRSTRRSGSKSVGGGGDSAGGRDSGEGGAAEKGGGEQQAGGEDAEKPGEQGIDKAEVRSMRSEMQQARQQLNSLIARMNSLL